MAQNQDRPKTAQQQKEQEYRQHVEQVTPKYSLPVRMVKAFVTGGIICLLGQVILNYATNTMGLDKETVDKIMAENASDIEAEKGKFEAERTTLQGQISDLQGQAAQRDTDLNDLKEKLTAAADACKVEHDLSSETFSKIKDHVWKTMGLGEAEKAEN